MSLSSWYSRYFSPIAPPEEELPIASFPLPDLSNQSNALDSASRERRFPSPPPSRCTLERHGRDQEYGGCEEPGDVIVETSSGKAWLLERDIGESVCRAVCGAVWSAFEVTREGPDQPYVKLYEDNNRTRRVTVKIMPKKEIGEKKGKMREDPMNEIAALDILSQPDRPHVLQKVAALEDDETLYLLMQAIDIRECQTWNTDSLEGIKTVRKLFRQLVKGMKYMHSKGICHARMCLNNVLFDKSEENAYITNFGWSLLMPVDAENRRLKSVPDYRKSEPDYCSRETFKREAYDGVKVDVFSAGAMLFRMLFGVPALTPTSWPSKKFIKYVTERNFDDAIGLDQRELHSDGEKISNMLAQAAELLDRMMDPDPTKRPTPAEMLDGPWMFLKPDV